ncbi:MAG: hypothetical protein LUC87_05665 [Clostridiales bacterium]|nr:hypothetical protein [Clostridiales bacterium]
MRGSLLFLNAKALPNRWQVFIHVKCRQLPLRLESLTGETAQMAVEPRLVASIAAENSGREGNCGVVHNLFTKNVPKVNFRLFKVSYYKYQ